jgi:hypothetical protein
MHFSCWLKPRQYLAAQAFSLASHIGIIKEYKTALASTVFNAFVGHHLQDRNAMCDVLAVLNFAAPRVHAPAAPRALIAE